MDDKNVLIYMPDYPSDQLPERDHFIGVIAAVYPEEFDKLLENSYKNRIQHYKPDLQESILISKDIKEQIDNVLSYKSK